MQKNTPIQSLRIAIAESIRRGLPRIRGKARLWSWLVPEEGWFETVLGIPLLLAPRDYTSRRLILGDEGSRLPAEFASSMPKGGCFVDVGSNRGPFACLAGRAVGDQGTIVAVEPNRTLWRPLLMNLDRHVGGRFLFIPAAIAEGPGWMSFVVDSTVHTGGGHLAAGSNPGEPGMEVPVCPVETAIAPFIRDEFPELRIKIDVEGAELIVLRSLAGILGRPECQGVLVEICPEYLDRFSGSRDEIYAFMDERGFDPRLDRDEADEILRRDTVYDQWFQRRD